MNIIFGIFAIALVGFVVYTFVQHFSKKTAATSTNNAGTNSTNTGSTGGSTTSKEIFKK